VDDVRRRRPLRVKALTAKAVRALWNSSELLAVVSTVDGEIRDVFSVGAAVPSEDLDVLRERLRGQGLTLVLAPAMRHDTAIELDAAGESIVADLREDLRVLAEARMRMSRAGKA
jgi:hypothetical protein